MPIKKSLLVERFWEKVALGSPEECWLWTGAITSTGYGEMVLHDRLDRGRQKVSAHRLSLMFNGIDCDGKVVHHKCHRILCVNPAHLELMENGRHSSHHHPVQWDRAKVKEAIHLFVSQHGVYPSATDWNPAMARRYGHLDRVQRYQEGNFPTTNTVQRLYGSWNAALIEAGCTYTSRGRRGKVYELARHAV